MAVQSVNVAEVLEAHQGALNWLKSGEGFEQAERFVALMDEYTDALPAALRRELGLVQSKEDGIDETDAVFRQLMETRDQVKTALRKETQNKSRKKAA